MDITDILKDTGEKFQEDGDEFAAPSDAILTALQSLDEYSTSSTLHTFQSNQRKRLVKAAAVRRRSPGVANRGVVANGRKMDETKAANAENVPQVTEKKMRDGEQEDDKVLTIPEEAVTNVTANGDEGKKDTNKPTETNHNEKEKAESKRQPANATGDSNNDSVAGQNGGSSEIEGKESQTDVPAPPVPAKDKEVDDVVIVPDDQRLREEPRDREVEVKPVDDEVMDLEIVDNSPSLSTASKNPKGAKRKGSGEQHIHSFIVNQ